MDRKKVFIAYPSNPSEIGATIRAAVELMNAQQHEFDYVPWEANDVAGRPLILPIIENVNVANHMVADISTLNLNVVYEIGLGFGKGKRVIIIRNEGIAYDREFVNEVGILDTLGHIDYKNVEDLVAKLARQPHRTPLPISRLKDVKAKTYILQTPNRDEYMSRIITNVKGTLYSFRSFDPAEQSRLAPQETLDEVAASSGVIVPILPKYSANYGVHNLRASFVIGLSHGLGVETLVIGRSEEAWPLDYRDSVKIARDYKDIERLIVSFRDRVERSFHNNAGGGSKSSHLEALDLGRPTAENEFQTLGEYYLKTGEYDKTLRGEVNLVLGRKGTGKTAIFSQVRDHIRRDTLNVVADLKPEGYQLIKLKDLVLRFLSQGTRAHVIDAFWNYLLLLEIAYKLLEKDQDRHHRDGRLTEGYRRLRDTYQTDKYAGEGDFTERLFFLTNNLINNYEADPDIQRDGSGLILYADKITNLLHLHDIGALRRAVSDYLRHKKSVWILFDNIDKGWSTSGNTEEDVLILDALISASRKLENQLRAEKHEAHCVIFLRNDVHELLTKSAADRGKDTRALLDWTNRSILKELLRKRFVYSGFEPTQSIDEIWRSICVPTYVRFDSLELMIDRCMMRPRYLLQLFSHCRGSAIGLGHNRIEEIDLQSGLLSYSNDLIVDTDNEIKDVFPKASGLIYKFLQSEKEMMIDALREHFSDAGIDSAQHDRILEILLWFGFLGVMKKDGSASFIYDVGYNMAKLKALVDQAGGDTSIYQVNPAFWPGLDLGI
jgi:hypothetical protein